MRLSKNTIKIHGQEVKVTADNSFVEDKVEAEIRKEEPENSDEIIAKNTKKKVKKSEPSN